MKKIITKQQYLKLNIDEAGKMDKDIKLKKISRDLFIKADKYRWLYQFSWLGEPIINLTTDMFAIQELIYRTKPKNIIEIGVAWGGSLLFYASLLKYINNGKVIGVDIFIYTIIFLTVIDHGLQTMPSMSKYHVLLERWEIVPIVVFSIEYILRIYSSPKRLGFIFRFLGCGGFARYHSILFRVTR